jgi:hypothetical protein
MRINCGKREWENWAKTEPLPQVMSSTKAGNESTHARKALKSVPAIITSSPVAYVPFS